MKHYYYLLMAFLLWAVPQILAQNPDLKMLMEEDQAFRRGQKVTRTDGERVKLVLALLAKGAAQAPQDKFNAAVVLQHTPMLFREGHLASESPDNYLLAHYLSKEAYEAGYQDATTMVAQSIDRYLSLTEGHQRYGTNRFFNQKTGKEELAPIDRDVPDSERAKYGVAPLAELLKQYPERNPLQKPTTAAKPQKGRRIP